MSWQLLECPSWSGPAYLSSLLALRSSFIPSIQAETSVYKILVFIHAILLTSTQNTCPPTSKSGNSTTLRFHTDQNFLWSQPCFHLLKLTCLRGRSILWQDICTPLFDYWTIKTLSPKRVEFLQDSSIERRRRGGGGKRRSYFPEQECLLKEGV